MNPDQAQALRAFLATLTGTQSSAFMDVLSSYLENASADSLSGDPASEVDAFDFLTAVNETAIERIALVA
jgi:hypothetical protein